ncbi:DUF3306 domain-containing protein [Polynucleobacter sinensis]|uniref:DUF3306 domain-containing protein n=1 Tax=Polynucleobacter sinensis TaxID=1743157 RepID=UPI0007867A87|nr:DUF3306 domain-containing protein [Polynucleobacter sinensis]
MAGGFLSRWSRRKAGEQIEPEAKSVNITHPESLGQLEPQGVPPESSDLPLLTLEDVEKIDRLAPDFSAFMKPGVDPAVQQAAMKKMFSDPHFNVMDGLDIYIDDYSKPDPIPMDMLKRMVQSDMLNIFRKDVSEDVQASETALTPSSESNQPTSPTLEQADLTSTHPTSKGEVGDMDPAPIDKKTS